MQTAVKESANCCQRSTRAPGVADRLGEPISEDILNNRGFSKIPKSRGFLRIFEVFEVFSRFIVSSIYYYIYVFYMYKVSVYMYYLVHIT